jgi:hypothetical protein
VDALVLAAESALNTVPWDYYTDRHGSIKPVAAHAAGLLDRALLRSPKHPLALHLVRAGLIITQGAKHVTSLGNGKMCQFEFG